MTIPGLTQPVITISSGLAPRSGKLNRNLIIALKGISTVINSRDAV